jgi:hypothetical protein
MHRASASFVLVAAGVVGGLSAGALAEPVEVVYSITSNDPSGAKSLVPGTLGSEDGLRFTNFGRIFRSPTTNKWSVVGTTTGTPSTADQVFVLGSGLSGVVQIREGGLIAGGPENLSLALTVPRVNDHDQWAVCFPAGSILSTTNSRVLYWDGAAFTMLRPGDAVPCIGGATYTGTFNGTNISNSGGVSFVGSVSSMAATVGIGGLGATLLINTNTDIPTGQMNGGSDPWSALTADKFWQDATGAHYVALGLVGFDSNVNAVAVVDGVVRVQKGFVVPGSGFAVPVSTITDDWMESNGDWFVKGSNVDGQFWLVRNGAVIAATSTPITPGATELWATGTNAFRDVKGDNRGNYIISGHTNNVDTTRDDVLVLNGARVLVRESDAVDLDGNGAFDDGMFVHSMQSDRSSFNNDGYYYFASRTKTTAAGTSGTTNSALLRVRAVVLTCTADFNADGDIGTDADIEAFFACLAGNCCQTCASADFNGDGDVGTDGDIESFFRVLAGGNC